MTETLNNKNIDVSVAVCHSGTRDIIDICDTMHEARASVKKMGLDVSYWWLAAEWINDDGDVNTACWGRTRNEALSKLKKLI